MRRLAEKIANVRPIITRSMSRAIEAAANLANPPAPSTSGSTIQLKVEEAPSTSGSTIQPKVEAAPSTSGSTIQPEVEAAPSTSASRTQPKVKRTPSTSTSRTQPKVKRTPSTSRSTKQLKPKVEVVSPAKPKSKHVQAPSNPDLDNMSRSAAAGYAPNENEDLRVDLPTVVNHIRALATARKVKKKKAKKNKPATNVVDAYALWPAAEDGTFPFLSKKQRKRMRKRLQQGPKPLTRAKDRRMQKIQIAELRQKHLQQEREWREANAERIPSALLNLTSPLAQIETPPPHVNSHSSTPKNRSPSSGATSDIFQAKFPASYYHACLQEQDFKQLNDRVAAMNWSNFANLRLGHQAFQGSETNDIVALGRPRRNSIDLEDHNAEKKLQAMKKEIKQEVDVIVLE